MVAPKSNFVIVMGDKHAKTDNLLSKYLRYEDKITFSGKTDKQGSRILKSSVKSPKMVEVRAVEDNQNTFTIDSDAKVYSLKEAKIFEGLKGGNEEKLTALQNMPIKKFIVQNKDDHNYRQKDFEVEKKLPMPIAKSEKPKKTPVENKQENNIIDKANTEKMASEFYRIGKVLGKGAFGKVNLAIHKELGDLVAIKSINKQYLADSNSK